jgi:hypothetical protein
MSKEISTIDVLLLGGACVNRWLTRPANQPPGYLVMPVGL